jgi:hypothetical protein
MKYAATVLSILMLIAASNGASAQSLKDSPTTLKVGSWSVLRSVDSMTDKVSCTGIYKSNYGIQLTPKALYVKVAGGIQSVTLRFNEEPPLAMRLPQKMEKDVGTVIIDGREFSQAVESSRIRLQALTLVRGLASEDLDTTGIKAAFEHIRAGCPVPEPVVAAPPAAASISAPDAKPAVAEEKACSEQLQARLKAEGVTDKQIKAACRNG